VETAASATKKAVDAVDPVALPGGMLRLLKNHGIALDARDDDGNTALHVAAAKVRARCASRGGGGGGGGRV
jgi:ankyrin repeat protein